MFVQSDQEIAQSSSSVPSSPSCARLDARSTPRVADRKPLSADHEQLCARIASLLSMMGAFEVPPEAQLRAIVRSMRLGCTPLQLIDVFERAFEKEDKSQVQGARALVRRRTAKFFEELFAVHPYIVADTAVCCYCCYRSFVCLRRVCIFSGIMRSNRF